MIKIIYCPFSFFSLFHKREEKRKNITFQYIFSTGSMKNCFGLLDLHSFFNIPYLKLQKDMLETKLNTINNELSDQWSSLESKQSLGYNDFLLKVGVKGNRNKNAPNEDLSTAKKI